MSIIRGVGVLWWLSSLLDSTLQYYFGINETTALEKHIFSLSTPHHVLLANKCRKFSGSTGGGCGDVYGNIC